MFKEELQNQIRTILTGLAGVQTKCFDTDSIEMWEVNAFKIKVIWNKKEFDVFYEDNSTDGGTSRVIHTFDSEEEFTLDKFYAMVQEVAEGLQNSSLINAGNNFTEQDIRESKELSTILMGKLDTLVDIIYRDSLNVSSVVTDDDTIYLLIREDYNDVTISIDTKIEGFTDNEIMARQYASHKEPFNQTSEYPKFKYEKVQRRTKI